MFALEIKHTKQEMVHYSGSQILKWIRFNEEDEKME